MVDRVSLVSSELNSSNFRDKVFRLLAINMAKIFYMTVHETKFGPGNGLSRYNLNEIFIDLSQNKVKMQYIFENFRYFYCFG